MENIIDETKFIMRKYNIKANKSLGQNFLIDKNVIETIVNESKIDEQDLVIEIGPGLGTLTEFLLSKAKKVICVELDINMVEILKDRFSLYKNFELINNDILKVNLNELIKKEKDNNKIKSVKVVANLPYYITTPIIMKLLEENLDIDSITVMVQKEVADRIIAIPSQREAGAITYTVYYYAQGQEIIEVPNNSFIPEPQVTSKVIKLQMRKTPAVETKNKDLMFNIIQKAFMQRRKTLLNALVNANIFENKEQGTKILEKLEINLNARAENLELEEYAQISNELSEFI